MKLHTNKRNSSGQDYPPAHGRSQAPLSDHVLNLAYNALCAGTCLEDLELRRQDEAYHNLLGAERIPDPTTAGDFCRRFQRQHLTALQEAYDVARRKAWPASAWLPDSLDLAAVDRSGLPESRGRQTGKPHSKLQHLRCIRRHASPRKETSH
jgi:hypothetical protein